jgi:hypothetical protein
MEVFDAELHAVYEAMTNLQHNQTLPVNTRQIFLCIDNTAAIHVLQNNPDNILGASMATSACNAFISEGISVTTVWTPSHCGIAGNERADNLAKSGTGMDCACPHKYTSVAWMTRQAKAKFVEDWRRKLGMDSLSWKIPVFWQNLNFHTASQVFKIYCGRTSADPLQWKEPVQCRCETDTLSSKHLIQRCPLFDRQRDKIRGSQITPPQLSNSSILDPDWHQPLLQFAKETGLGDGKDLKWPTMIGSDEEEPVSACDSNNAESDGGGDCFQVGAFE